MALRVAPICTGVERPRCTSTLLGGASAYRHLLTFCRRHVQPGRSVAHSHNAAIYRVHIPAYFTATTQSGFPQSLGVPSEAGGLHLQAADHWHLPDMINELAGVRRAPLTARPSTMVRRFAGLNPPPVALSPPVGSNIPGRFDHQRPFWRCQRRGSRIPVPSESILVLPAGTLTGRSRN